jgi:gluconolactonase
MRKAILAAGALALAGVAAWSVSAQAPAPAPAPAAGVVRLDPALDALIDSGATVEKAAGGVRFAEGPLWRQGALWFSDLIGNKLMRLTPDGKLSVLLDPSGYDGHELPDDSYKGSNGMASAPDGTLTLCQHGNRRIVSLAADGKLKVLVDSYEGQKLNSPNDVVYAPDGSLYFTDPPFGLPKRDADPAKELKFNGVFRFYKGKLQALVQDIPTPNGIAFAPDYKTLYVTDVRQGRRAWIAYDVAADGGLANGRVFADATAATGMGTLDGMKVDAQGNVWATGPGGVWIMSKDGRRLGTIAVPEVPSSVAFGGADRRTLYITARTSIYKVKVKVAGFKPPFGA